MMTRLILVREGFSHMSAVSGFDPLSQKLAKLIPHTESLHVDYMSLAQPSRSLRESLGRRLNSFRKQQSSLSADAPPTSSFNTKLHKLIGSVLQDKLNHQPSSKAFLTFGENQYVGGLAAGGPALRQRLVVCLHQPPSWHKLYWRDNTTLQGLGAIVCLSNEAAQYLRSITADPVFKIRHGVALDFFQPRPMQSSSNPPRLLMVGQWLRDFDTLETAFSVVNRIRPDVELDCVIPRSARNSERLIRLARHNNVRWHCDLSPERLLNLYQSASLLFLPLIDATANNAIVEACACGLPIISTAVGGISEYVQAGFGELCPPADAEAHANAVLCWLENPQRLIKAQLEARQFAEQNLNWRFIAQDLFREIKHIIL
jgi:glycosyltransferase involved in cell wall biosynthesis